MRPALLWRRGFGGIGGCLKRLTPGWIENRRSVACQEEGTVHLFDVPMFGGAMEVHLAEKIFGQ